MSRRHTLPVPLPARRRSAVPKWVNAARVVWLGALAASVWADPRSAIWATVTATALATSVVALLVWSYIHRKQASDTASTVRKGRNYRPLLFSSGLVMVTVGAVSLFTSTGWQIATALLLIVSGAIVARSTTPRAGDR